VPACYSTPEGQDGAGGSPSSRSLATQGILQRLAALVRLGRHAVLGSRCQQPNSPYRVVQISTMEAKMQGVERRNEMEMVMLKGPEVDALDDICDGRCLR